MDDFSALRQRMVDNQIRPSDVTDRDLIAAFLAIPREAFVAASERPFAYSDRELSLPASTGNERRMLDPATLARLIQSLRLTPAARTMVVGAATGYSTAIVSSLVTSLVAVEQDPALAAMAEQTLSAFGVENAMVVRAALTDGYPAGGPYDAILIDGAVEVLPETLTLQLRAEGLLATIERRERISRAMLYERVGGEVSGWPQFEAGATLLPGFEKKAEFVF